MTVVMSIAGSDSSGGAGIQADLKTFSALNVYGTFAITAITAQNTMGVSSVFEIPPQIVAEQIESVIYDMEVKYVKTGMLYSPEIVEVVANQIKKYGIPLVIDPVIFAERGGVLLKEEAIDVLIKKLIPLSMVITPNIQEASILSRIEIRNLKDVKEAAMKIREFGVEAVIITGGHLEGEDVLYDGDFSFIKGPLIKRGTHGSGCTYSAAITAQLAKGKDLYESAIFAKRFVRNAIIGGKKVGRGNNPIDPVFNLHREVERNTVRENVKNAVEMIRKHEFLVSVIPEVGCNIGMGISAAEEREDIAAIEGRIVKMEGRPHPVGCVEFGASDHISRVILRAMESDEKMRAAMNIRFDEKILSTCEKLGMKIASFERREEPEGVKTMDWGIERAIRSKGYVPDVIYDRGGKGKEAMIRILGRDAIDVMKKAIKICKEMGEQV
ncbi:MAG: bifunctional hydroxymethylpyrimidine kinase/phosphomethylpyrimidine kinase [Candidatus Syntropharchaeia archaeon]